MPKDIG